MSDEMKTTTPTTQEPPAPAATAPVSAVPDAATTAVAAAAAAAAVAAYKEENPPKRKKKNVFVRFLNWLFKSILFIILIIAVGSLLFIVFVDNAEAQNFMLNFTASSADKIVSAVKGLFA